jgi:signal transduction histidine kinase
MKKKNITTPTDEIELNGTKAVLDALPVGIQLMECIRNERNEITDFRYLVMNAAAKTYADHRDLAGSTLLTEYPDSHEVFEHMKATAETGAARESVQPTFINGVTYWLNIQYNRLGQMVAVLQEDITGFRKAQERIQTLNDTLLRKNRQLESLNSELQTFNSIAASDYKETLRNLYTGLEFIARHEAPELSEAGKANVRRAQASIQKMKLLTEDIIAYSTVNTIDTNITKLALTELLTEIKNDLGKRMGEENIVIECHDLRPILGYKELISLLLNHLIDNAIKFRKEGEELRIILHCTRVEGASVQHPDAIPGTLYEVLEVKDNGPGFEEKYTERVFDMFFKIHDKGKYKGSGIGLAICKKIMDIHGGFITVQSTPGHGTSFSCFFPLEKS